MIELIIPLVMAVEKPPPPPPTVPDEASVSCSAPLTPLQKQVFKIIRERLSK